MNESIKKALINAIPPAIIVTIIWYLLSTITEIVVWNYQVVLLIIILSVIIQSIIAFSKT